MLCCVAAYRVVKLDLYGKIQKLVVTCCMLGGFIFGGITLACFHMKILRQRFRDIYFSLSVCGSSGERLTCHSRCIMCLLNIYFCCFSMVCLYVTCDGCVCYKHFPTHTALLDNYTVLWDKNICAVCYKD